MKVLMIHLGKPSSSEANVLANLLAHLDADIEVELAVNELAVHASPSFFSPVALPGLNLRGLDVGLPLDPQEERPLAQRLAYRVEHLLRRKAVVRLLETVSPELVYTSQQRFDCHVGALVSRELGVPHVVHLHYTPGPWLRWGTLGRIRACDRVIAVSRFIADAAAAHGTPRSRISVLHNTIDLSASERLVRAARSRRGDDLTVGMLGRMAPGKGFRDGVRAFARLKAQVPAARLVLIGDGSERPALERLVQGLGLGASVQWSGWVNDPLERVASFDVLLNPARHEPFGLVVLEAAAVGVPVVGYAEGGVKEIVISGETGLLVRPGRVESLAAALIELATDRPLRERMGASARRRAACFDPAAAGRAFSDTLYDAAESGRKPFSIRIPSHYANTPPHSS